MLTNGKLFVKEKEFDELHPFYNVTSIDIQEYIKNKLIESRGEL